MPFVAEPPKPQPPRKLSKGEHRRQTVAAFLAWRAGQTSKKDN
jgi:energy-coupling factor transporter ATP-binding protein EcfA2